MLATVEGQFKAYDIKKAKDTNFYVLYLEQDDRYIENFTVFDKEQQKMIETFVKGDSIILDVNIYQKIVDGKAYLQKYVNGIHQ